MSEDPSKHDLIDELADEFVTRRQAGESPTIDEYCQRHPKLEKQIRELFPTLAMLEDVKPRSEDSVNGNTSPPEKIGDYHIIREIGRGGMSVVYEAEHEALARRVALKVLAPRLSRDIRARARFEREARAVAKMHHTNIVPLFEVGEDDGRFFLAMQLIPGRSLDRVIAELQRTDFEVRDNRTHHLNVHSKKTDLFRLSSDHPGSTGLSDTSDVADSGAHPHQQFRSIARIALQATDALAYAHNRSIIHRDIKPSNLLLDDSGVVWLTDFGLAKTDDDELTKTGDFLGTLRYMAPERFKGECDFRSDIYSLGLTIYELLVHRPAFESTDRLELVDLIQKSEPPRPRSLNRRIPRDLETIVLKAIDKDPKSRYPRAGGLADDLHRFINDRPIRARRVSVPERLFRWSRRNKSLAASLFGVLVLLTLLAVGSTVAWLRESDLRRSEFQQRQFAEQQQKLAEQRGTEIKLIHDKIKRRLYFSEMNLAGQGASDPYGAATVKARLTDWFPENAGVDLRGWEWYYLYSLVNREHFVSEKFDEWSWSVDFSPDGKQFAASVNSWGFKIWDTATGKLIQQKKTGSMRAVAYSPDGTRLAGTDFRALGYVWNLSNGKELFQLKGHKTRVIYNIAWSPDGKQLATCSERAKHEHVLRLWDATTGKEIQKLEGHKDSVRVVRWNPDGTRLASVSQDGTVRIWDATTGKALISFNTRDRLFSLCWSPDGNRLLTAGRAGNIQIWDLARQTQLGEIKTRAGFIYSLDWRPGEQQIASGHTDGTVRVWDMITQTELTRFYGHTDQLRCVKWMPDGSRLASASLDRTVRVWNVNTDDPRRPIQCGKDVQHFDWNHDSTQLAVGNGTVNWNGELIVWDAVKRKQRLVYKGRMPQAVAWSPGDKRLAFGGRDSVVHVWNSSTETLEKLKGKTDWVESLSWNPDGTRLASGNNTGGIIIWDGVTKKKILNIAKTHKYGRTTVDWSSDSTRLASAGAEGTVKVWDTTTGKLIWKAKRDSHAIFSVRWSPDGKQLATSHDGAVVIWDGLTGAKIKTFDEIKEQFWSVDWSPDGARLATGSRSSVSVWDVASGHLGLRIPSRNTHIKCVRWSHDGKSLVVGGFGGPIQIYDATLGYRQAAASLPSD